MINEAPWNEAVDAATAELAHHRATLLALKHRLSSVPAAQQTWARRQSNAADPIQVDLLHGAASQWSFWEALIAQEPPSNPVAVFPDFSLLMTLVLDNLGMARSAALGAGGMRTRLLTSAEQLADEKVREAVVMFAQTGIDVRTLPTAPGWFYVDGSRAVVPLEWDLPVPTSLVITRDPAVVASLLAFFDELWDRAQPPPDNSPDWTQVLSLAAQGLSDGAIADTLGISLRTVRRRLADAARSFGVSSRFALGVEWERSRSR